MTTSMGVDVFEQGTIAWEQSRQLFDASLDRRPGRIFRPRTSVSAVDLVKYLQREGRAFTLKSGGHSAAGLSIADGLPMVDLSLLRRVRVDRGQSLVTLEAGAQILDLDRATAEVGMATTGGTVSHTGVVGLACGGGLGWLMGLFGLACDNIMEAVIVTSGNLVTITESSPEMRTIRGAGTTLGFISELTMRIHAIEDRFCWTTLKLGSNQIVDVFARLSHRLADIPDCVGCAFTIQSDPAGSVSGIVDVVAPVNRPDATAWANGIVGTIASHESTIMSYGQVQQALDPQFSFGKRSYRRSLCLDNVEATWIDELVRELGTSSVYHRSITFDILHGEASRKVNELASSFVRRRYVTLFVCQWSNPRFDLAGRGAGRRLHGIMASLHGKGSESYGNYSSEPNDSKIVL